MPFEIVDATDRTSLRHLFERSGEQWQGVAQTVQSILQDVRSRGDAAVVEHTRAFDAATFNAQMLNARIPPLNQSGTGIPDEVAAALQTAYDRVVAFHRRQLPQDIDYVEPDGTAYGFHHVALGAVAAYVPAGSAPLASSVIMTVVPAKVAGVGRIVVLCPPQPDGTIHPAILYACALCGVDELYAAGGAQAIAAAAFGTASILAVDKIVGPGNRWVTEAKRQVFGTCGIDGLAGPSEVLVVADASGSVQSAVWELIAQAEHDPASRVALVSESMPFLQECRALLQDLDTVALARGRIIRTALENGLFLIHARQRTQVIEVIEAFAPEHLALQVEDAAPYLPSIRSAGAIFIGTQTPVAWGDYIAGSNHVLPTGGSARFASGLRTLDFMRSFSVVCNSPARARADAGAVAALAHLEGLTAHARTAEMQRS